MTPDISVILPVYNAEKYLEPAIRSILMQEYKNFELLIINDGSTDDSMEIARGFQANDSRIVIIENPQNLKLIRTLNVGLEHAKGKYIARQDSDDISLPGRLQKQYDYLESHPDCVMLGCSNLRIDAQGKVYSSDDKLTSDSALKAMLLMYSGFCGPSVMMRKDAITANSLQYDLQQLHAEDYDFYCRLSACGKVANLPDKLYQYRIHGESVSDKNLALQEETAGQIAWREIKRAGLGDRFTYDDVLLMRKHTAEKGELGARERLRQIGNIKRLARACVPRFDLTPAEQKALLRLWLDKCRRTLQNDNATSRAIWSGIYEMAGRI